MFTGSQVVEDGFKRQSKATDLHCNRQSRMEKVFHVLLQREVLHVVHNYDEVQPADSLTLRSAPLPPSSFHASAANGSLPLHSIIGKKQHTRLVQP